MTAHLSRLSQDPYSDHERVEHFVLFEQTSADIGVHVEADVVNQDSVKLRPITRGSKTRRSKAMHVAHTSKGCKHTREWGNTSE